MTVEQLEVLKTFTAAKVAASNEGEGRFTALVSVFGNVDCQGDIVDPAAFDEAIAKFDAGGWVLPIVWSHDFWRAESVIGEATSLSKVELEIDGETVVGLQVEGLLDVEDSGTAATVFRHMKLGRITEFSFSGRVTKWSLVRSDDEDDGALRIENIDLWEVGPCFKGANPETRLLSVKSRVAKTGRTSDRAAEEPDVEPAAEQDEPLTPEPDPEPDPTPDADVAPSEPEPPRLSKSTQALLGLIAIP